MALSLPNDRYTEHFWSLAVEEHFYLLLPFLLVVAKNNTAKILAALSALFFVWSMVATHLLLPVAGYSSWRTDLILRFLFIPALFAVL